VSESLAHAIEGFAPEGAAELVHALERLLEAGAPGGGGWRVAEAERLPRDRVLRLCVEREACTRGLFVKRLPPERAHRERAAIERWLPRVGLAAHGPPLLQTVAEPAGRCTWFVYEDLGPCALLENASDAASVGAAVALVAELHARCVEHALLGEARSFGADLGMPFYTASVRDATRALEALAAAGPPPAERRELCERLLGRLARLRAEQARRAASVEVLGGPETLLHGDLWTSNVLVRPGAAGLEARLIDWDHAGVGPICYDLSTFLLRFPASRRAEILAGYLALAPREWPRPTREQWNELFETAELARLANATLWRALTVLDGHDVWGLEDLEACDADFAALAPVLPAEPLALATRGVSVVEGRP
jgi:aminoglycoside/choline kinase family phosphotransferase